MKIFGMLRRWFHARIHWMIGINPDGTPTKGMIRDMDRMFEANGYNNRHIG